MKKFLAMLMLAMLSIAAYGYDFDNGLYLGGGVNFNANYLWRGYNLSGVNAQPTLSFGYNHESNGISHDISLTYWGSYGRSIIKDIDDTELLGTRFYGDLYTETDLILSYYVESETTKFGVMLANYFYGGGSKFFYFKNDTLGNTSQVSVSAEFVPYKKYPLTFYFETTVLGADNSGCLDVNKTPQGKIFDAQGRIVEYKRSFSTYVEVSYPIELPEDITLTPRFGFTPHKSFYNDYQENFTVNNLQVDCTKSFQLGIVEMQVFGQIAFNFFDAKNFEYNKNFHWNVGIGINL